MDEKRDWPAILEAFNRRNIGRTARLELADPEWGVQRQEPSYPLRGVAYDPRDDRVEIMLGEPGSTDAHLTHTIPAATRLELATQNGEEILHIAHGAGRTLVRLG